MEAAVQIRRGLLTFPSPEQQEVGALTQPGKRAPGEGCQAVWPSPEELSPPRGTQQWVWQEEVHLILLDL